MRIRDPGVFRDRIHWSWKFPCDFIVDDITVLYTLIYFINLVMCVTLSVSGGTECIISISFCWQGHWIIWNIRSFHNSQYENLLVAVRVSWIQLWHLQWLVSTALLNHLKWLDTLWKWSFPGSVLSHRGTVGSWMEVESRPPQCGKSAYHPLLAVRN